MSISYFLSGMVNPCDGILLIDKNEGETSFDVVKQIRRILKIKKIGHAGTLDPFATGLLIILLGQGTKLSPYLMAGDKIYRATMRLGLETDTKDLTGRVVRERPVPEFESEYIKEKALEFVGEIEQVPPIFSAVNYRGRRAYEYARKGIKIDLEKRRVKIHSLEIISVDLPDVTMEVSCSSGTYIRSLASGLGKELSSGAHLKSLRRLSSGPFRVKDALNINKIERRSTDHLFQEKIIPLREALPHMKEVEVDDGTARKIRSGHQPEWGEVAIGSDLPEIDEDYVKFVKGMELVAIVKVYKSFEDEKRRFKMMRAFH